MDNPQRRYPRINKLYLIAYVNREGEDQRTPVSIGKVLDISPAGLGVEVYEDIRTGSVMEMEIDLQDTLVAVQGKVVHVRKEEGGRIILGVEFNESREEFANLNRE
jgi:hypothetical protein